jgi:CheY-like chemotaxis protein
MLEEHGYSVIEAANGKAALEQLASSNATIALALTDVAMPGMSGPELAARIVKSHPSMKIVYTSGYAGQLLGNENPAGIRLLEKPFTRAALLKTLHEVLG